MKKTAYTEKSASDLLKLDPVEAGRFLDQLPLPERVEFIMGTSGRERQDSILLTSHPEEVVAFFPPEELFFTIKEIGAADALPLISLTTPQQLHFILDIDWWQKDRLKPKKIFEWLRLLFACSEDKVASWLNTVDFDLLVSLFKYFTTVFKVGAEEDKIKDMDTFPPFTVDNYYFIRFKEPGPGRPGTAGVQETLGRIVAMVREMNPKRYFDLMESLIWGTKAESEEYAYRWRQARLADRGVPTFHEALDIYKPPSIHDIRQIERAASPSIAKSPGDPTVPAPVYPLSISRRASFALKALELIRDREVIDRIKREWAYVCNHVVMAEVIDFDALKDIKKSVQKTAWYLNIGLEYISQGEPERAGELLPAIPLTEIFRLGYAQAVDLKKKAISIINKGYLEKDLSPADEPWRSLLAGLLRRHPLYYDPHGEDRGDREDDYRDFAMLREVQETRERLEEAELIGGLVKDCFPDYPKWLKSLPLTVCNIQMAADVTWSIMLFTAVAQKLLNDTLRLWPLTARELNILFPMLWAKGGQKKGRKLAPGIKKALEKALIGSHFAPSSGEWVRISRYLNSCYERLEQEMGFLDTRTSIDPRYIRVLLLEV